MEAYFINPISRSGKAGSKKTKTKRRINMAKKRKSSKRRQPAALRKYWAAKRAGKKSAPAKRRKASRRRKASAKVSRRKVSHRRRHQVRAHRVHSYRRPRSGASYISNPIMSMGKAGSAVADGLIAAGVLFGALFAVGYANGLKNRVPFLASGWGAMAGKLAIALGAGYIAHKAAARGWISREKAVVASAAGFAPLALDILGRVAPGIAGSISLADGGDMNDMVAAEMGAGLQGIVHDGDIAAEMGAEMGASEESYY